MNKFKIETALVGPTSNKYYIVTNNYDLSYYFNDKKTTIEDTTNGFNMIFSLYNNSENNVSYILERDDSALRRGFHILDATTGVDLTYSLFGVSTLAINTLPTKLGFIM